MLPKYGGLKKLRQWNRFIYGERERERENVLPESQQTPNSKIYGKLVQHPLYINNLSTD